MPCWLHASTASLSRELHLHLSEILPQSKRKGPLHKCLNHSCISLHHPDKMKGLITVPAGTCACPAACALLSHAFQAFQCVRFEYKLTARLHCEQVLRTNSL